MLNVEIKKLNLSETTAVVGCWMERKPQYKTTLIHNHFKNNKITSKI